jgi:glucokinase
MDLKMTQRLGILALDVGGTSIKGAIISGGQCLEMFSVDVDSSAQAEKIVVSFLESSRLGAGIAAKLNVRITGIGVSVPGPFDYKNGISLMTHKYAAIRNVNITEWICRYIGNVPIRYISDSAALLLGCIQEQDKKYENVCVINIGTGLGIGCMVKGRILENDSGGPAIVIFNRPYRDAIAEDYVSKRAIMAHYYRKTGVLMEVIDIEGRAKKGDRFAHEVFHETGYYLAEILLPVVKEYQFECVILGGRISKAGPLLCLPLSERFRELGVNINITTPKNIDIVPLLGAVADLLGEAYTG